MLRLAARMRSRPGMRMAAMLGSRRPRMQGMRFATHGTLAGMPFGGATLAYLAVTRPPLQLQYRLNWRGQIQLIRNLSARLVERALYTQVMKRVERLFGHLAPALPARDGRSVSPRSILEHLRRQRDAHAAASRSGLRAAALRDTIFVPLLAHLSRLMPAFERSPAVRRHAARPPADRPAQPRAMGPAAWFTRMMSGPNATIGASQGLLRPVRETLRLFRMGAPAAMAAAAYTMQDPAAAAGGSLFAQHPVTPMRFAARAAAPTRFVFGLRGGETLLRWLRTSHAAPGSHEPRGRAAGFVPALVRQLHTQLTLLSQHAGRSLPVLVEQGMRSSRTLARMARWAAPQVLHKHRVASGQQRSSNVVLESIISAQPRIGPGQRLTLVRSLRTPGKHTNTLVSLLVSRLSRVFRQDKQWRSPLGGVAWQPSGTSPADARQDASAPSLLLQRLRTGGDIARLPVARFARDGSPAHATRFAQQGSSARRPRLALATRLATRHDHRAAVSLVQRYEPALATAYGRGQPPPAVMAYRETPRAPELQWSRQVQRIEQQITRNIVQNITQAMPWRGDMEKAVLTPRVMRELAEQVGGIMTQRIGLERYRRGL